MVSGIAIFKTYESLSVKEIDIWTTPLEDLFIV